MKRAVRQLDLSPPPSGAGARSTAGPAPGLPGPFVRLPAVSNTERQRKFRQRNPGYYGRIKAKERARSKASVEKTMAIQAIVRSFHDMPLMLPAPVETLEMLGINALPTRESIAALRERIAEASLRVRD